MMRGNFSMKPPILDDNELENIIYDNKYKIYRNCYFEKIKNGESKENVLNRLIPYFENDICYTFNENKFPLIVTHKHCSRVLMKYLLNMDEHEFESFELPSKKILYLELNDNLKYKTHSYLDY